MKEEDGIRNIMRKIKINYIKKKNSYVIGAVNTIYPL